MSTYQRRRGIPATLYPIKVIEDSRGNKQRVADKDKPITVKVWTFPQRSAKAEVPGQQHIDVTRIGTNADIEGIELWSQLEFRGDSWDMVTPPMYHHGTRVTRHWSIDIRQRP